MSHKILIVEDDFDLASLYHAALEDAGYTVETLSTGGEVVEKARDYQPDAILLDIMLPGMNGMTLLRQLKQVESTQQIPVYVLTVLEQQTIRKQALEMGATDYWVKSNVTPKSLAQKIDQVLR